MTGKKERINRKLAVYSAAAAAALAVAPATANALVVYSGTQNLAVNSGTTPVFVDLDNNGNDDFSFNSNVPCWSVRLNNATSGSSAIDTSGGDVANLASGYSIKSVLTGPNTWTSGPAFGELIDSWTTILPFNFTNTTGYIGVAFNSACGKTYGWIQFTGTAVNFSCAQGTIVDWAYEDICGTPILAGATTGGAVATVPTMGEWGMLLLAGLLSAVAIKAINREEETA